jgi:hypothetical protein
VDCKAESKLYPYDESCSKVLYAMLDMMICRLPCNDSADREYNSSLFAGLMVVVVEN